MSLKRFLKEVQKATQSLHRRRLEKFGSELEECDILNIHQACNRDQPLQTKPLETVRVAQLLSLGYLVVSEEVNSIDKELYENIVLVEKDIFHERKWSPYLVGLLQNKSALVDWQLSAYNLFKEKFRPSKLLHDARVWDGGVVAHGHCQWSDFSQAAAWQVNVEKGSSSAVWTGGRLGQDGDPIHSTWWLELQNLIQDKLRYASDGKMRQCTVFFRNEGESYDEDEEACYHHVW